MDYCAKQLNSFVACEEMRGPFCAAERRNPVFCPKPRRLSELTADAERPIRWQANYTVDPSESKAGAELLEIFLTKGGEVASSPPFFCGSPPSRAANPVVHDARFGEEKPLATFPTNSSPMSPRKACTRAKFGLKPAAVRVEGFECRLDRDRRSVTAVA